MRLNSTDRPKIWDQLRFDFAIEAKPAEPDTVYLDPNPSMALEKCKNPTCSKRAANGKAYCSKAHSPFGLLEDEPDNAPIEWSPPEGVPKWAKVRAYY